MNLGNIDLDSPELLEFAVDSSAELNASHVAHDVILAEVRNSKILIDPKKLAKRMEDLSAEFFIVFQRRTRDIVVKGSKIHESLTKGRDQKVKDGMRKLMGGDRGNGGGLV